MTDEFAVARARSRLRLPVPQRHQEARLTRLLRGPVLESGLAAAAAAAGFRGEAIVCLRRVRLQCVLRDGGDAALVDAWSAALADAVLRAVRAGADGVRIYRSRHAALLSMTRAALRGDLTDAWAWVQAGIWPDAEPTSPTVTPARILDALIATPEAAPGIVADAAAAGRLDLLLARELLPRWRRLADAVARSHDVAPSGGTPLRVALELPKAGARAAIRSAAVRTAYDREIVRQLLRIAIVAEAPSRPASWLRWALAALNESIELAVPTESSEPRALPSPARSGAMATGSSATRTIAVRGAVTVRLPAPAGQAPAALDPGVEPGAATEWGGLLFLIHVVKEIDLPGRHRTGALGEAPARQSLRWVLHQLATTLLALDPADPAALAFAGLGPDEPPPPQDEPPADAADSTPLAAVAEEITAALRVRLQATELTVDELMDTVCRRAARVVCDPGWIEIRLALDEVRTDVRRAGLDLDPGWLPFLGVVLRFTYE